MARAFFCSKVTGVPPFHDVNVTQFIDYYYAVLMLSCLKKERENMPRQRHGRRHSVVVYGTGVKPPKPGVSRYGLIDFTLPIPSPARPYPCSAMKELLCAVGVVPTRVYPQSGRISALAGREGRLRACTEDFQLEDWQR